MAYRFTYKNKFQPVSLEQEEAPIDDKTNKNPFRPKSEPNTKSSLNFEDPEVSRLADDGDDDVLDQESNDPQDSSVDTDKPMSKVSFTEFLQVMSKAFATAAQNFTNNKQEDFDFKEVPTDNEEDLTDSIQDEFADDAGEKGQSDDFNFDDDNQDEMDSGDDDFGIEKEGEDFFDEDGDLDDEGEPDRQGDVRYVKGAHLVFRREDPEEGTFEELWIFNTGKEAVRKADSILRDILAGTDIDQQQIRSEDGTQSYSAWSIGNAQMVHVKGLPS